jgi:hypothetical protein
VTLAQPAEPERVVAAFTAVGLAFDSAGGLVLASGESLYAFPASGF